jgi:hypothetical protein
MVLVKTGDDSYLRVSCPQCNAATGERCRPIIAPNGSSYSSRKAMVPAHLERWEALEHAEEAAKRRTARVEPTQTP